MDSNLRPSSAKSSPMPSRKNSIQFWKSFVGDLKCVREAEQMLHVSGASLNRRRDVWKRIEILNKDAPIDRQLCGDTTLHTEGQRDLLRTFQARERDCVHLV